MTDWLDDYLSMHRRGMYIDIGGQILGAAATIAGGRLKKDQSAFQADYLRQNAGQVVAASQRDAINEDRKTQLVMSRAMAVAAASGGGAKDPGVLTLIANHAAEGAYRKQTALFQGQDRAQALLAQADATQAEGKAYDRAGKIHGVSQLSRAYGTFMRGGAEEYSLRVKYGLDGPKRDIDEAPKMEWYE